MRIAFITQAIVLVNKDAILDHKQTRGAIAGDVLVYGQISTFEREAGTTQFLETFRQRINLLTPRYSACGGNQVLVAKARHFFTRCPE